MRLGRVDWVVIARGGAAVTLCLALANCGKTSTSSVDNKWGVAASPRVIAKGEPVPKGGGRYSVGKPYQIAGRTYTPEENPNYKATGIASWYGDDFHGRKTANGEIFDMESIVAAHPTLPLPSYVRVTNLANKRSLVVRVNDRGPYHEGRVIDLSMRAAQLLDFHRNGIARVKVEYVGRAALEGSDDMKLASTLRHDGRSPAMSETRLASIDMKPGTAAASPSPASQASARPLPSRSLAAEYFDPRPMVRPEPAPRARPETDDPRHQTAVASAALPPPPSSAPSRNRGPQLASAESVPVAMPAPRGGYEAPAPRAAYEAPSRAPAVQQAALNAPAPGGGRMVWNQGPAPVANASFDSRFGNAAPAHSSGSAPAYAPVRHDGSIVTGRGLY